MAAAAAALSLSYLSVGCNRAVRAGDWSAEDCEGGELYAYGAHDRVVIYDPSSARALRTTPPAHSGRVSCVRWIPGGRGRWLVSGGADGAVIVWRREDDPEEGVHDRGDAHAWRAVARGTHAGPVTDVATHVVRDGSGAPGAPERHLIVSTAHDCVVRAWLADLAFLRIACASDDADAARSPPPPLSLRSVGELEMPRGRAPLCAAVHRAPARGPGRAGPATTDGDNVLVLAIGCADGAVKIFACDADDVRDAYTRLRLEDLATLDGHADWVRGVTMTPDAEDAFEDGTSTGATNPNNPGLLLASASQDRTARIWRLELAEVGDGDDGGKDGVDDETPAFAKLAAPPRPPARTFGGTTRLKTRLEALLVGHEDWVLSATWRPRRGGGGPGRPSLLTSSMDRSLTLWVASDSGAGRDAAAAGGGGSVWMAAASMGEAAASCLGFYGAAFNRTGDRIIAHSHGGALHAWREEDAGEGSGGGAWTPTPATAGHAGDVACVAWDVNGRYLLTSGMDFTTRLHADWRGGGGGGGAKGWRQIARPQVHGHAIRCVATLPAPAPTDGDDDASTSSSIVGSTVFVSGADEKILRVFRSPGTFLGTLGESLPASASAARAAFARARAAAGDAAGAELPQLGLSNKAVDDANGRDGSTDEPSRDESSGGGGFDDDVVASVTPTVLAAPPTEETLAQATLWPETCKLYGHGDDLSCVAAHPSGKLIASACEARREGAADVWIWEASASGSGGGGGGGGGGGESGTTTTTTTSWRPAGRLPGATLTVVSLAFAPRGARDMLLAASRDRHVCVYVPARPGAAAYGAWGADGWRLARRAKAHAKAIYSAAWAPPPPASAESPDESVFATGARDRRVKLWVATAFDARGPNGASTGDADVAESPASSSIPAFDAAATAVAFAPPRSRDGGKRGRLTLAIGLEDGRVRVWSGGGFGDRDAPWTELCVVSACDGHAGAVRALAWRPVNRGRDDDDDLNGDADGDARGDGDGGGGGATLATVGADHSVRLFDLIGV